MMASAELEAFVDETIRVSHAHGYNPTVFVSMRFQLGTIEAIIKLVESPDIQSGFKRLAGLGLLDHTIEAAVLQFPGEFSERTRQCAEFRLGLANAN
jgi:hypothetical protein